MTGRTDTTMKTRFKDIKFNHTNLLPDSVTNFTSGTNGYPNPKNVPGLAARVLYARYLYVLMYVLKGDGIEITIDNKGPTPEAETARAIAQWAINVVDFR